MGARSARPRRLGAGTQRSRPRICRDHGMRPRRRCQHCPVRAPPDRARAGIRDHRRLSPQRPDLRAAHSGGHRCFRRSPSGADCSDALHGLPRIHRSCWRIGARCFEPSASVTRRRAHRSSGGGEPRFAHAAVLRGGSSGCPYPRIGGTAARSCSQIAGGLTTSITRAMADAPRRRSRAIPGPEPAACGRGACVVCGESWWLFAAGHRPRVSCHSNVSGPVTLSGALRLG